MSDAQDDVRDHLRSKDVVTVTYGGVTYKLYADASSVTETPHKSLEQMANEVFEWTKDKGWEPNPKRTFGDEMVMLHSEISEAIEAYREIGVNERTTDGKPDDVASEFADILIRLLHECAFYGIDLEAEYERKMAFNQKRPWRHGGKKL